MESIGLYIMIIGGITFTILPKFKLISAILIVIGYTVFMNFNKNTFIRRKE